MSDAQIDKLKKLLALTASDNDNEALAAIRHANRILKETPKTWPELICADLSEVNGRYEQLRFKYAVLAREYDKLLKLVAAHNAVAVLTLPQRRMPLRRMRRF